MKKDPGPHGGTRCIEEQPATSVIQRISGMASLHNAGTGLIQPHIFSRSQNRDLDPLIFVRGLAFEGQGHGPSPENAAIFLIGRTRISTSESLHEANP